LEQVLKEDEHHIGCLTYYSQVALDVGQTYQAIPFLLRAIVTSAHSSKFCCDLIIPLTLSSHLVCCFLLCIADAVDIESGKLVKSNFAKVVGDTAGVNALMKELHTAATSPSALTFLAQTIKDQGAIHSAIALYDHALKIQADAIRSGKSLNQPSITSPAGVASAMPKRDSDSKESDISSMINIVLNLIHTHEVAYEYQTALDVTKKFLAAYPDVAVGSVKASTFAAIIANVTKVYDPKLRAGTATDCPAYTTVIYDIVIYDISGISTDVCLYVCVCTDSRNL
jgi:tetratricopeptide (TPR) repeat protein